MGASLLPRLAAAVTVQAPHMRLSLQSIVPDRDYEDSLATGGIDLLIANWPKVSGHLRSVALSSDRLICVVAEDHPLALRAGLDLAEYLAQDHISPSGPAEWRFSPVDAQLARLREARRIRVVLPDYTLIPQIVAATRLVLTTGAGFAGFAARTAAVRILTAPPEFEEVQFRALWHERSHADEAHVWLRGLIRRIAAAG
jgi:DNA-binding transcriptional LysR family regulator